MEVLSMKGDICPDRGENLISLFALIRRHS